MRVRSYMKVSLNIDFEISQLPISEMNIATNTCDFI